MVYTSDSPEATMNNLEVDYLAKIVEINNPRNPRLILTVFAGNCGELPPYIDTLFPYYSQVISVHLSQDLTIAPYSTRVVTLRAKDEGGDLFRKGTSFQLNKQVHDPGNDTYHVYCSHDGSKYPLTLNNPYLNSNTIKI